MRLRSAYIPLIFFSIILPVLGSLLLVIALHEWRFEHVLGHSIIEALGALAALTILIFIATGQTSLKFEKHEIAWIAAALLAMGLLDLSHAIVPFGNSFVWLHSFATLAGGLLFACVWLHSFNKNNPSKILAIVMFVMLSIVVWSIWSPESIPAMTEDGEFTLLARLLNILGGAGFIAGFVYFLKKYNSTRVENYYLLATHSLLFGMAGILFELSAPWDATWWWWHVLRFAAYGVLVVMFMRDDELKIGNPLKTLRGKIILLACCLVASVSTLIGVVNYVRTAERTIDTAINNLGAETRLIAVRFQGAYDAVKNEARIISRTPPITGLMRSIAHNDIDPKDGSTTELWRKRLATIFISVIQETPYYTQIRYVGVADKGRELVRVNRTAYGLVNVPLQDLQQKENESYVQTVMQGRKTFFFSKVSLNREHGQIEQDLIPTIRAIVPVMDGEDKIFGMIIINVDFKTMLKQMFEGIKPEKSAFLINQSGDYAEYDPSTDSSYFEFHESYTKSLPKFFEKFQEIQGKEIVFNEDDFITYHARVQVQKSSESEYVGAVLRVPRYELLAVARDTSRETILMTFVLIAISLLITSWFAHTLTMPLMQMTNNIRRAEDHAGPLNLPVDLTDEIGELARAFQDMITDIVQNEAEREKLIEVLEDDYEREKLIKELERSNADLDDFAYVASHDLKAPLRVIDNASRWLEEDLTEHFDEESHENMALLRNRVSRMEKLFDDLLEYSRIGRNKIEKEQKVISGKKFASNILLLLAPSKDFTINFSPEFNDVELPRMPLQQVLLNLIGNALKHHDKPTGTINVTAQERENIYFFTVEDDGPGIAPEYQEQVFKMFQTLKPRDQVEGSGMGLAMVRKHIENFNGEITLVSSEGAGCTFHFTWPKQLIETNSEGKKYG